MAAVIVQKRANVPGDLASATATKTVSFASSITAGSSVYVAFYAVYGGTRGTFTCTGSDAVALTRHAAASAQGVIFAGQFDLHVFYLHNHPGGITTFTIATDQADFNGGAAYLQETTGLANSVPDAAAAQAQTGPGTGTDVVTSGLMGATTQANDHQIGFCFNDDNGVAAGTGFTSVAGDGANTGTAASVRGESATIASSGATVAATFTHGSAADTIASSIAFKISAAADVLMSQICM